MPFDPEAVREFERAKWNREGDAETPPYRAESFDAVVSNFGIHHVPRPDVALNEAYRILRHGGRFAFSIWSAHDENIAWKLVFDAVRRHGDPRASTAPPPGGGFATVGDCLQALDAAGFSGNTATLVRRIWLHSDAVALLAAFRGGTVRMAAMLDGQTEAAMQAILAGLESTAAEWRDQGADGGQLAVPVACVIAAGIKR
jgi:SAM-dependent methyltransferase